jgi:hypothetical protein
MPWDGPALHYSRLRLSEERSDQVLASEWCRSIHFRFKKDDFRDCGRHRDHAALCLHRYLTRWKRQPSETSSCFDVVVSSQLRWPSYVYHTINHVQVDYQVQCYDPFKSVRSTPLQEHGTRFRVSQRVRSTSRFDPGFVHLGGQLETL